jgi:hypothetical protein
MLSLQLTLSWLNNAGETVVLPVLSTWKYLDVRTVPDLGAVHWSKWYTPGYVLPCWKRVPRSPT